MNIVAMYLRKSRADAEAEKEGAFETLTHHKQILEEYARKTGLKIVKVYKELVSGDSIEARPEMQKLLSEVKQGLYDGVLVTEISRLARGRTKDQGVITEAFRDSGTKIYTPSKVYDPADDQDETFVDFELFMARLEYKYIKKRLIQGRRQSMKNGSYVAPVIPPGYKKVGKGTIAPDENAPIIKDVFQRFSKGEGTADLCKYLRTVIPSRSWDSSSFLSVIKNPIYCGYLQTSFEGKNVYRGNWEPIISEELFEEAQAAINHPHIRRKFELRNAFAGLIYCEKCGRAMVYAQFRGSPYLIHQNGTARRGCTCSQTLYEPFKDRLIEVICDSLPEVEESITQDKEALKTQINDLKRRLSKAEKARDNLFDAYDQGAYSLEEFKERRKRWDDEVKEISQKIEELSQRKPKVLTCDTEGLRRILRTGSPKEVNAVLKQIIRKITYFREKGADYTVKVYPSL